MTTKATPTKLRFSKRLLEELPVPDADRQYLYDERTPGLAVCVSSAGAKVFYLYRKIDGKPVRVRLGAFPGISVEQARKLADKANARIANGHNPQADKRAARAEWTLGELFDHYLEQHAKPRKRTWKEDEAQYKRYLSAWKSRKLSAITDVDVQGLHARVGRENGHYAANRLRALLCTLFNVGARLKVWAGANPTAGVKKFREKQRQRFLHGDELPRFFEALDAEQPAIRDFFRLALLTGARRSNLMAMRWDELHLERATWDIPRIKNDEPQTVHLPVEAVRILQERQLDANGSPWVFPANRGYTGHFRNPQKAFERIRGRAGLKDLRIHDLRRTLGSWQAASGTSLPIIGKSLGHKSQQATAVYARLDLDPVRESVDRATAAMMAAAGGQREGK